MIAHRKNQKCRDSEHDIFAHHRNQSDPDRSDQDSRVQAVRIRRLVRTSSSVNIAERHRDHDGSDNDRPDDLRRTEIRCQQTARSQLYCHNGHSRKKLRQIQK